MEGTGGFRELPEEDDSRSGLSQELYLHRRLTQALQILPRDWTCTYLTAGSKGLESCFISSQNLSLSFLRVNPGVSHLAPGKPFWVLHLVGSPEKGKQFCIWPIDLSLDGRVETSHCSFYFSKNHCSFWPQTHFFFFPDPFLLA